MRVRPIDIRPTVLDFFSLQATMEHNLFYLYFWSDNNNNFYYLHWSFSHQLQLMVFYWSLSYSMSPQVSRTLLNILAVLNNVVVWMVSTHPPTSKSSGPFSNPLVNVLFKISGDSSNGLNYNWYLSHFVQFFHLSSKVQVFVKLFVFFHVLSVVCWYSKNCYKTDC